MNPPQLFAPYPILYAPNSTRPFCHIFNFVDITLPVPNQATEMQMGEIERRERERRRSATELQSGAKRDCDLFQN